MFQRSFPAERFADALRNTVCVVLPLLFFYHSQQHWAIGISVGALLISLTDLPGSRRHKLGDALRNTIIFFVLTLVFLSTTYTGIVLVLLTFVLAMLSVFGGRSGASGTMGIALLVFLLGLRPEAPVQFAWAILIGCVWFQLVSLLQVWIWPYRSLKQALLDVQAATADFLRAKADHYDLSVPLDKAYQRTIALHIRVWEKQELVRQLLPAKGNAPELAAQAVRMIALYEQVTAMHYDYAEVRETLPPDILARLADMIRALADGRPTGQMNSDDPIVRSVLVNIRAMQALDPEVPVELDAFRPARVPLRVHLSLHSPVLRFAVRLSILFAIGYYFAAPPYGYWLLLTIVIVARPRLALTWQRNLERLGGTAVGLLISAILLWLVTSASTLLFIASIALFAFFLWNRPRYNFSVTGITIAVVLCLSLYHGTPQLIITARLLYSLGGCALAFIGLFIFPVWVKAEVSDLSRAAVAANRDLLLHVTDGRDIRHARKTAHLHLAKLSEGLAHARLEPGHRDLTRFEQIQVLNYRINGVIISLYLSGKTIAGQTALLYLDAFLNGNSIAPQIPVQGLSKGLYLLEQLCAELTEITQTKVPERFE